MFVLLFPIVTVPIEVGWRDSSEQNLGGWTIGRWYRRYFRVGSVPPLRAPAVIERQLTGIVGDEVLASLEARMTPISLSGFRMPWTRKLV